MKKLLVVSSLLLAFSGMASAESQITLYGVLDGGLNYYKLNHRSAVVKMANGHVQGNRWGIKGSEDLGNGYVVSFQLEQGFRLSNATVANTGNIPEGSTGLFTRQSTMSVKGGFGELAFGRMGALSSDMGTYSIFPASAIGTMFDDVGNVNSTIISTDRYNNSVIYITPKFAGIQARAMYSNGTVKDEDKWRKNNHYYGLGAVYTGKALTLTGILENIDHDDVSNMKSTQFYTFGVAYNFGSFNTQFLYQYARNARQAGFDGLGNIQEDLAAAKKGANQNAFSLGLGIPCAGGDFNLQATYGFGKVESDELKSNENKYNIFSAAASYVYPISKRTKVYGYAGYRHVAKLLKDYEGGDKGGYSVSFGLRHAF